MTDIRTEKVIVKYEADMKDLENSIRNFNDQFSKPFFKMLADGFRSSKEESLKFSSTFTQIQNIAKDAMNGTVKEVTTMSSSMTSIFGGSLDSIKKMDWGGSLKKMLSSDSFIELGLNMASTLVTGFIKYIDSIDNATNALKRHKEALNENRIEAEKLRKQAEYSYQSSLDEISVAEKYTNYINQNTDETGKFIGDQDILAVALKKINEVFPELNLSYDKQTQKIIGANNAAIDFNKTLKELIETKKMQRYVSSYDDYFKASVGEENRLNERQKELEIKKLENNEKLNGVTREKFKEVGLQKGYSGQLEYLKENGLTEDKYRKFIDEEEQIIGEIELNAKRLVELGQEIGQMQFLESALLTGDYESFEEISKNFKPLALFNQEDGRKQLDDIENVIGFYENSIENLNAKREKYDEDSFNRIQEYYAKMLQQQEEEKQKYIDSFGIGDSEKVQEQADAFTNPINKNVEETGLKIPRTLSDATNQALINVEQIINDKKLPDIHFTAKGHVVFDSPFTNESGTITSSTEDKKEGKSKVSNQKQINAWTLASSAVQELTNTIGANIGFASNSMIRNSSSTNSFTQTNIYNSPVTKPSDVTKANKQAAQLLAKVG